MKYIIIGVIILILNTFIIDNNQIDNADQYLNEIYGIDIKLVRNIFNYSILTTVYFFIGTCIKYMVSQTTIIKMKDALYKLQTVTTLFIVVSNLYIFRTLPIDIINVYRYLNQNKDGEKGVYESMYILLPYGYILFINVILALINWSSKSYKQTTPIKVIRNENNKGNVSSSSSSSSVSSSEEIWETSFYNSILPAFFALILFAYIYLLYTVEDISANHVKKIISKLESAGQTTNGGILGIGQISNSNIEMSFMTGISVGLQLVLMFCISIGISI